MTERNEPERPDPTAPTEPVAPMTSAAGPAGPATTAAEPAPAPVRRPWYRHVWVPVAGGLVLVLLAFGSGVVAGQAMSWFGVATVASADDGRADPGGPGGHGWRDGGRGHGDGPGPPGPLDGDRGSDSETE